MFITSYVNCNLAANICDAASLRANEIILAAHTYWLAPEYDVRAPEYLLICVIDQLRIADALTLLCALSNAKLG